MYIPNSFKPTNIQVVKGFIQEFSFATLICQVDHKPFGVHIPIELAIDDSDAEVLYGHVAKANPIWKAFASPSQALVIFQGPHAYVSSSWYGHENVPTWNYIAVHVYGPIIIIDETELWQSLKALVDKYEAVAENPVSMEKFSEKTLRQMKGIVGFKMQIKEVQAAYKLSQNRNDEDYQSIINHLHQKGPLNQRIASEMNKKR